MEKAGVKISCVSSRKDGKKVREGVEGEGGGVQWLRNR